MNTERLLQHDPWPAPRSRRVFLRSAALGAAGAALPGRLGAIGRGEIPRGERPPRAEGLEVLNPFGRVPLSFIIDDSTCLVNMGHFCMPQFAQAWPERASYQKDWPSWPREIPDAFVRKFADWCREQGVKGKYSVVPYPACVGWVDRFLPGWGKRELEASLALVRDELMADWDIHPEMISHTRVLDLNTGRPLAEVSRHTMENSYPDRPVSVDEVAAYIAYALQVLKNIGLPCEGFTTPGGFGNRVKSELSVGGMQALRSVFSPEVPHYFKYLETGRGSTAPQVEHAAGLRTDQPTCMVNVIGGTGDWFGGWDGVSYGEVEASADRFITADGSAGRMVEMIERGEPAIMLCHWPGIYCNGLEVGFEIFKRAVTRLNASFGPRTRWMKLSEIARYWAAKELTAVETPAPGRYVLQAPFPAPGFTVRVPAGVGPGAPRLAAGGSGEGAPVTTLRQVASTERLEAGSFVREGGGITTCFDLPKGTVELRV